MSYTVEVSNVTGKNRNFPLRRLDAKGNGYLQDFKIPAYALNHKLTFASEDEYKKWASNYEAYVSGKNAIIKVGKSNGNALEKQNKDVEKEEAKKVQEDQSKMKATDEDGGIKIEVEKMKKDEAKNK